MKTTKTKTQVKTWHEKAEALAGKPLDEFYLLHYGRYVYKYTVESAAKSYFNILLTDKTYHKKAEKLGLI